LDQMIMGSAFLTVINPLEVKLAVMKVATEVLWVTNPDSTPAKLAKTLLSVHLAISRRKRRVAICLAFSLIVLIPTKNRARPARTVPKISNILAHLDHHQGKIVKLRLITGELLYSLADHPDHCLRTHLVVILDQTD